MANDIIGREQELQLLQELYDSPKAELVAVYGRRRVGKTFLIDKKFDEKYDFYVSGIYEGTRKEQLTNFAHQMEIYFHKKIRVPKDWMSAFFLLQEQLESLLQKEKVLIFIDELPWLDTARSRFLKAFDIFWNEWASKHDNMKMIVCGSATTWMTNKFIGSKGGLHNRVTQPIHLAPFNLNETEQFLKLRGFEMARLQVVETYMAMGGTPYYLNMMRRNESVAQNMDRLFFASNAPLRKEYDFLFRSLFNESTLYRRVVETLAKKQKGMTRQELLSELKQEDCGYFSDVLNDLCDCDFLRRYTAYGKSERDMMYQLTDLYSLFYLRFVKSYHGEDEHYWSHRQMDISAWEGYAFEQVCLHHIPQIKDALGITGVLTNVYSWSCHAYVDANGIAHKGAQIDLVIERGDKTINLCEMKYTSRPFIISSDYADWLKQRREIFRLLTGTNKTLHLTIISASGVEHNAGWQILQSEVGLNDLFG